MRTERNQWLVWNDAAALQSQCVRSKEVRSQFVTKRLNANKSPPHSFRRQKTALEAKTEGALNKTTNFVKRSFRQDVRTNQKGNENDGAQAGKRSCWAWRFGHELSTLGEDMKIQKRGKVMTTAKKEWSNARENRKGEKLRFSGSLLLFVKWKPCPSTYNCSLSQCKPAEWKWRLPVWAWLVETDEVIFRK